MLSLLKMPKVARPPAWLSSSSRSWAGPDSKSRFLDSFVNVLRKHFSVLEWQQQTDLAKASEQLLSTSLISGWLQGDRTIHREHINRLAWVLARAYYEKSDHDPAAIDSLDGILNELLEAAGFGAIQGARDVIWAGLSNREKRILRVGWVDYESFSVRPTPQRDPEGIAASVMVEISRLMGATLDWHNYSFDEIIPALTRREIYVVAPLLMVLPSRLFKVQFSTVLPRLHLGVNGVVHKEHRRRTRGILPAYIKGEVGAELCSIFAPGALAERSFNSVAEARQQLLSSPVSDDLALCLVADNMICANLVRDYPSLELLPAPHSPSELLLPVAVAVHPDEPKLLSMINTCIDILQRTGYFDVLYETSPHAKALRELGVIEAGTTMRSRRIEHPKKSN